MREMRGNVREMLIEGERDTINHKQRQIACVLGGQLWVNYGSIRVNKRSITVN